MSMPAFDVIWNPCSVGHALKEGEAVDITIEGKRFQGRIAAHKETISADGEGCTVDVKIDNVREIE